MPPPVPLPEVTRLPVSVQLVRVIAPPALMAPPREWAVLLAKVELRTVGAEPWLSRAPPSEPALLPAKVLPATVSAPSLSSPPPSEPALPPVKVQLVTVRLPVLLLWMPAPFESTVFPENVLPLTVATPELPTPP